MSERGERFRALNRVVRLRRRAARVLVVGGAVLALIPALAIASSSGESAKAVADAINLRSSDLPGFKSSPSGSSSNDPFDARLTRCDSGLLTTHPGEVNADSPEFTQGGSAAFESVSSSVSIETSATIAAHDLALAQTSRVLGCFTTAIDGLRVQVGNGQTTTIVDVHVSRTPFSLRGTDAKVDVRIQFAYGLATTLPFYLDLRAIATGRDELSLVTVCSLHPCGSTFADHLASLLLSRALARPH